MVRPPGHHAEKNESMGFCLFNNVAMAAHYATQVLGLEKVMIVDSGTAPWTVEPSIHFTRVKKFSISPRIICSYYPGTGSLKETGQGKGEGLYDNVPLPGYQGDVDYATIFDDLVVPIGREYKPQIILVSAGFDIYRGDPLGTMEVTAPGFAYLTRTLVQLAEEVCDGRLLVTLEGGYNLDGQRDGILAVLGELSGHVLDTEYSTNLDDNTATCLSREK